MTLRCTGFNNVDIDAARELKLTVTRGPVYSPYAVAEHAVALLLTLSPKIHRAFNGAGELKFSLNGFVGSSDFMRRPRKRHSTGRSYLMTGRRKNP